MQIVGFKQENKMGVKIDEINGIPLVKIDEDFDITNAGEVKAILNEYIEDKQTKKLIIDLSKVDFIDSTAIGVIVKSSLLMLNKYKGKLVLINVQEALQDFFSKSNLDKFIEIFDNLEQALNFLESN